MNNRPVRVWLSAILMIAVTVSGFAGGQQEGESGGAEGQEEQTLILWDIQTQTTLKEIVDETAQQFREDNPDVDFEVVHVQNDPYKTKLTVAMGADTPPEIFHTWGGGPLKAYVDAGKVMPINDIVDALRETHIPAAFDPVSFDGNVYGVPYGGLTGVFMWYRKDIFDQYGLEPPETWDELIEVGETLKENGVVPIALANATKWTGSLWYMYLSDRVGGADMFVDAYAGTGSFADPGYVRAGEMLMDLVERDFFPQGFNGMDYDTGQSRTMLYTGRAGMMLMGSWLLGAATAEAPEILDQIGMFPFPAVTDGDGDPTNLIGSPGQNYFAIAESSNSKEIAGEFLRDYVMDDNWVEFMAENGFVPPVRGAADFVDDSRLKESALAFERANHVQVYYDQYLPPELGENHKDLVQALFGGQMSPREVAEAHQRAYEEYMANQ